VGVERPSARALVAALVNHGTKASARSLPGSVCQRRIVSGVTEESPRSKRLIRIARHGSKSVSTPR
jgi:hypothetical protein